MLPAQVDILWRLARMELEMGNRDEARRVALSAYASLHGDETNAKIEALLEELEESSD